MPKIAEQTTAQHMPQTGAFMVFPPNSVSNSQPGFRSASAGHRPRPEGLLHDELIDRPIRRHGAVQLHWEMSE